MKKKGKYARRASVRPFALILAVVLVIGCAVGGTLAWLTDTTDQVTNTFTASNIKIELTESDTDPNTDGVQHNYKMIPGHYVTKDPKVTVLDLDDGKPSEDCWLFVEITESAELDQYIAYAIDDLYNAETNPDGWQIVSGGGENDLVTVIGRKVLKTDATKSFSILGEGTCTDDAGTVTWGVNQVGVKPSVTEQMMDDVYAGTKNPQLTFTAYATQLMKDNDNEFSAADAWKIAKPAA